MPLNEVASDFGGVARTLAQRNADSLLDRTQVVHVVNFGIKPALLDMCNPELAAATALGLEDLDERPAALCPHTAAQDSRA
jgi:hypothetical protein